LKVAEDRTPEEWIEKYEGELDKAIKHIRDKTKTESDATKKAAKKLNNFKANPAEEMKNKIEDLKVNVDQE